MHKPMCASVLALRDRVAPRACLSIGFPDFFLGTEEGSQVLIPVAAVSAATGQISSQGALFVCGPIVSYRSYCKRKLILCANEEVEHGFMPPTSSLVIRK